MKFTEEVPKISIYEGNEANCRVCGAVTHFYYCPTPNQVAICSTECLEEFDAQEAAILKEINSSGCSGCQNRESCHDKKS